MCGSLEDGAAVHRGRYLPGLLVDCKAHAWLKATPTGTSCLTTPHPLAPLLPPAPPPPGSWLRASPA